MPLTDTMVKHIKPKDKPFTLRDIQGLSLYISPTGTKSWHFRFTFKGKEKRLSLGTYPTVSLKDARILCEQNHIKITQGILPTKNNSHHESEPEITFADFALHWKQFKLKKLHSNEKKRQSTAIQIERYLRKDLLPGLGNLPLSAITQKEILRVLRKIEDRGALSITEKCRGWLHEIFRHAIAEGYVKFNPVADIDIVLLPSRPVRHNPYLKVDELPMLLTALNHYQGDKRTRLGIKLLLLTAVRPGELRYAEPAHFDLEAGLWKIPPEQVKQLQKLVHCLPKDTVPPFIVPLPTQAIAIIKELLSYRFAGQRYLLPHRTEPTQCISETTLNQCLKRLGYKDRLTTHGIRATISTALNEAGYPKEWIEAQLSHVDPNQARRAYNHAEYVEQRRQMMQEWADNLDKWEASAQEMALTALPS